MSKKPKRKKSKAFPPPSEEPKASPEPLSRPGRPMRWDLVAIFLIIALGGTYLAIALRPGSGVPRYTYEILREFPHDSSAFTQGLLYDDGFLWESTGRYGESTIRKVDLETGKVLAKKDLPEKVFGEGLAIWKNKFIQLTWKEGVAYVYDREFKLLNTFNYQGQGWGLTHDGSRLIMSDGTATLRFFDPETFEEIGSRRIRDGRRTVGRLNELEFHNGKVYANQWQTDLVYEIDPDLGEVTAIIDLTGLWPYGSRPKEGLLNGIAINTDSQGVLVTGKLCPKIYEVQLKLAN